MVLNYLNLIRWKNLAIASYTYLIIHYVFFNSFQVETKLNNIQFFLLLFTLLFIMAAGNIINDIYDIEADIINKPEKIIVSKNVSIEIAKNWYKITNSVGIVFGVIFSFSISNPTFFLIFVGISTLLYYYSKKLKRIPLISNILVASLIAFSILLLVYVDIDDNELSFNQNFAKNTIVWLSFFAFGINLLREIIKDIEDVNGDNHLNIKSLPIIFGRKRTQHIVFTFTLIPIALLVYFIVTFSETYKHSMLYLLFFSLIPLLYFALKINSSKSKKNIKALSFLLKLIMVFGINAILILSFNNL